MSICSFDCSHFSFEDRTLALIASVPGHAYLLHFLKKKLTLSRLSVKDLIMIFHNLLYSECNVVSITARFLKFYKH